MVGKNRTLFFIFNAVFLFGTANSTFQLLDNVFFKQGLFRSLLGQKCAPSIRQFPGFADLAEYAVCLRPIPWINGTRRHPDQDLRASQVIAKYGYNVITYNNVTTQDGYILTVHRVTGGTRSKPRSGKPAVLLFHGLGTDSDEWVLQSEEKKNLPMKLVNDGYEVWLANARGTDLSRGHLSFNAFNDLRYWDFTFHEMGIYDLPAILDLMTTETGNEKVFFVGHNYGATVYAAGLAEKPELNDKIEASVFLGPSIFTGHANTPLRPLFRAVAELEPFIQDQIITLTRGKLTFGNWMLNPILARFCTPTAMKCGLCGNLIFFLYGFDPRQTNFRDIPNIVSKVPNTISFKTAIHMGQSMRNCDFGKFDYGRKNSNKKVYGREQVPQYNLTNLRAPVHIYFGNGDNLAPVEDIVMTRNALPKETLKEIHRVPWKLFNNADFTIAKDAETLVYDRILETFKEYTTKYQSLTKKNIDTNNAKEKPTTTGKPNLSVHVRNYRNNETQEILDL